tara:strand:- start:260 stop:1240 length:981 start_codon:yes stop_codon:yes gene_type:complete
MKILVTGGAGFIGSNFIRYTLQNYPEYEIINIDKLTYCGNLDNLKEIENHPNYKFVQGDICDEQVVNDIMQNVDIVVHFAAESHVDNSIKDPFIFTKTNVIGTHILLEAARKNNIKRFLHISTDEVYGSLKSDSQSSVETDNLDPRSPYSASKAAAEHIVRAYFETYKLPVVITRSSNNYGPYQYPEKLIPLFTTNLIDGKKVPLMWSDDNPGMNIRDWLHVIDNCRAFHIVLEKGELGEIYNVAGENERTNLKITRGILSNFNYGDEMIQRVEHRKGHDFRYSVNCDKLKKLGFVHKYKDFESGLKQTVQWYKDNDQWWRKLKKF